MHNQDRGSCPSGGGSGNEWYKHALRRLKLAYPGELFDGWGECSAPLMFRYAQQFMRVGHTIPAAAAVAREVLAKPAYLVPVPSDHGRVRGCCVR